MSMEYPNPRDSDPNVEWARMSKTVRLEEEVPPDTYFGMSHSATSQRAFLDG
jgi:hypothetical protein